ncbi:hypothetical protein P7C70_g6969, partial [Phenoliferia sp. Uapishka_3]
MLENSNNGHLSLSPERLNTHPPSLGDTLPRSSSSPASPPSANLPTRPSCSLPPRRAHIFRDYQGHPYNLPALFVPPSSPEPGQAGPPSSSGSYETTDRESSPSVVGEEEMAEYWGSAELPVEPVLTWAEAESKRASDLAVSVKRHNDALDADFAARRVVTERDIDRVLNPDRGNTPDPTPPLQPRTRKAAHSSPASRPRKRRYQYHPADHINPTTIEAYKEKCADAYEFAPFSSSP